ncbi:MAG: OB-fold domain-containing protein [Myxococcota bacterium]|nr:OB-fold domain-containing protein [Myxococcota bacterium]
MTGIVSYGAYVPPTRLPLSVIGGGAVKEGGPEKAVAWADEDAVTMAVTAAANALRGFDREAVDAVFFASTTHPFQEKQGAALVARALDLRREVETADLAGSLRAGTAALRRAVDAVHAGSLRRVLVVASDCRMAAPGSALERNLGDGAAAFLVGDEGAVATLTAHHAVSEEIVDVWRTAGDPFVHAWEERFVVQEAYTPAVTAAVRGLLEKAGAQAADFAKVALTAPDARSHGGAARALRLDAGRLQDPLFGRLGSAGCAFAPLLLAAALEDARPGERILVAAHGDGAEALGFAVGADVEKLEPRRGVSWHLARRRQVPRYDRYLAARELGAREYPPPADPGLSATVHFRERDEDVSFKGQRCTRCGGLQFPVQRVCERCFAKDAFETVRLADRVGHVVTYTLDHFFPTPEPPTIVTVTDVDGARVHLQLVECDPQEVRLGMPVEMRFRRIHRVGGRPNYYWKAVPLPEEPA